MSATGGRPWTWQSAAAAVQGRSWRTSSRGISFPVSSPLTSTSAACGRDDDDDGKDVHRSSPLLPHHHHHQNHKQLLPSPLRSLLALEDPRPPTASLSYRILLAFLAFLLLAALLSAPSLWSRLNVPYLCQKEGIMLHCPQICNAVAIVKIMGVTLILPVLKQDQIWKGQTKFEDIFDVDHFINYLKDDVRIIRDIADWFTEKDELFTSIK